MATARAPEPSVALPAGPMFAAGIGIPAGLAVAWWLVVALVLGSGAAALAGLAGAAVVAVSAAVSTLVITPWRTRPIGLWMSIWLGGTTVRLLLAPALTFLLYSATSLDATALGLSVGVTYLATLLGEAGLLARHVNRTLPSQPASDDPE